MFITQLFKHLIKNGVDFHSQIYSSMLLNTISILWHVCDKISNIQQFHSDHLIIIMHLITFQILKLYVIRHIHSIYHYLDDLNVLYTCGQTHTNYDILSKWKYFDRGDII